MFPGPDSMGFVWGRVGRGLMQFMHFSAIFAMLAVLAPWGHRAPWPRDPVVPTLRGVSGDVVTVYDY